MAHQYCGAQDCLKRSEYTTVKTAFCPHCGNPFDAAFKRVVAPPPAYAAQQVPAHYSPPPGYVLQRDPAQYAGTENIEIPHLPANAITAQSSRENRIVLSESALKNATTAERPAPSRAPNFGDDVFKSTAAETRRRLEEMKQNALARESQPAVRATTIRRKKSAK